MTPEGEVLWGTKPQENTKLHLQCPPGQDNLPFLQQRSHQFIFHPSQKSPHLFFILPG